MKRGDIVRVRGEVLEVLHQGWVYVRFRWPNKRSTDVHVRKADIVHIEPVKSETESAT